MNRRRRKPWDEAPDPLICAAPVAVEHRLPRPGHFCTKHIAVPCTDLTTEPLPYNRNDTAPVSPVQPAKGIPGRGVILPMSLPAVN